MKVHQEVKGEIWSFIHPLNFNKYKGEYIALVNDRIVAHRKEFEKVYRKALNIHKEPTFAKVPENELMIL